MKKIYHFLFYHFLFISFLYSEKAEIPEIYSLIKDIYHPTLDDYRLIQSYLNSEERVGIDRIADCNYYHLAKNFKIIGEGREFPDSGIVSVHAHRNAKENCVITYSSFNRNYPKGLRRLIKNIKYSDFRGDILYRIGGWPDTEGGSLVLAHVPYAFKVAFFKEAQRLGYKRALWLDTCIVPLVSLNYIFWQIQKDGYFAVGNYHSVGPFMNKAAAASFGLSLEETFQIPSCSAGIFGVDFTNEKGAKIIDLYYEAAQDKNAYYSARQEQNALSIILFQLDMFNLVSISQIAHKRSEINSNSLFLLDRDFVQ
jgi:hypothetical protein